MYQDPDFLECFGGCVCVCGGGGETAEISFSPDYSTIQCNPLMMVI